jgi:hypothetical protein
MWTDELGRRLDASRPAANGVTPSDVARGLPDLVQKTVGDKYKASDFIAYIQFPEGKRPLAQQMADALRGLGMRTPGIEERKANSPLKSQIRYYKPAHAAVAREIAARLKERTGIEFETRLLSNIGRLPDGIIEFWLGTS